MINFIFQDKERDEALDVLNQYDFSEQLRDLSGSSIGSIMDVLSMINEEIERAIDNITRDDFSIYLHSKYNMYIESDVVEYAFWGLLGE